MGLLDLKEYLMKVKIASLATLCQYFQCESGLLQSMLAHWVRKGSVRCFKKMDACGGGCVQCGGCATEIYEWVGFPS